MLIIISRTKAVLKITNTTLLLIEYDVYQNLNISVLKSNYIPVLILFENIFEFFFNDY